MPNNYYIEAEVRGVRVRVILLEDGTISTAYPTDGAGVRRNPELQLEADERKELAARNLEKNRFKGGARANESVDEYRDRKKMEKLNEEFLHKYDENGKKINRNNRPNDDNDDNFDAASLLFK
jgi:phosphopantothenoylcysteine synthetase/decarboxylase